MPDAPHSAAYFGDTRDFWWNPDFLGLMAQRWGLARYERVLDVGCGVGHWGRLVLGLVSARAVVTGVDAEAVWVEKAAAGAAARGLSQRMRYVQGKVEALPFADGAFDLVTCQTVLMHLRDVDAGVREMLRVLAPGGRIFVVEPNNLANSMVRGSLKESESIEERLALVRFQALCEHGKRELGEGDNSVGDVIPGVLARLGVVGVEVYQSDRAAVMLPPYASPAQQADVRESLEWAEKDFWIWSRGDTRRYFVAGRGGEAEFEGLWALAKSAMRKHAASLRAGTYHSAGGHVNYLISGTKLRRVLSAEPLDWVRAYSSPIIFFRRSTWW